MRLVTTPIATVLTGLSTEQLREWSSRRALIPADVQRRGRGSPAQYSWQTLLLLRVAVMLKDRFHLELHAHRRLFTMLHEALVGTSFLKLWGCSIAIYNAGEWGLLDSDQPAALRADAVLVRLDPHLAVLAAEFAMPSPVPTGQLELFPARLVPAERKAEEAAAPAEVSEQPKRRRA